MLDILITRGIILTMDGKGVGCLVNGAVGIKGDKIEVVGPTAEVEKAWTAHRYIDAERHVVMPGFVDAHLHSGIGILRGVAQDIHHWMQQGLWPFTQRLNREELMAGSLINIIEGVKAGTTTFCDYNSNMGDILQNHIAVGTRVLAAETINELALKTVELEPGEVYSFDPAVGQTKLLAAERLIERWHGQENGRIKCLFGPQGPDMLSLDLLREIKNKAEQHNLGIHMHVAQGDREIEQMEKRYKQRSIPFLESEGMLNPRLLAVHLTEATPAEVSVLARKGATMVLCAGSIGIIDGIVPPLAEFLSHSARAALGTDQTPGNNCCNMFNEMKMTAVLNKCRFRDPSIFPAWQVLRLATIDGARAIGKGEEIGSLTPGKKADIIVVNLDNPSLSPFISGPVRNIVPNLVYSARGHEVEMVIIDGRIVVEAGELMTVNEIDAITAAREAGCSVAKKYSGVKTPLVIKTEQGYL